jgi:hypothetical protein
MGTRDWYRMGKADEAWSWPLAFISCRFLGHPAHKLVILLGSTGGS